jgi:hypothetical protein
MAAGEDLIQQIRSPLEDESRRISDLRTCTGSTRDKARHHMPPSAAVTPARVGGICTGVSPHAHVPISSASTSGILQAREHANRVTERRIHRMQRAFKRHCRHCGSSIIYHVSQNLLETLGRLWRPRVLHGLVVVLRQTARDKRVGRHHRHEGSRLTPGRRVVHEEDTGQEGGRHRRGVPGVLGHPRRHCPDADDSLLPHAAPSAPAPPRPSKLGPSKSSGSTWRGMR